MKKQFKNKGLLITVIILFSFVHPSQAIFEGNTKPNDLPSIRNSVEIEPFGQQQKATAPDLGGKPDKNDATGYDAPIADFPWIIFGIGLTYSLYIFNRKTKRKKQ